MGHPVGGGDCGLDVGDGRPVGEVGDPVGTPGHLGAGAAVAGAAEVLVVAVGGGPGAPHGWLHRVGTAPELVAAVLLVLPSLQPPAHSRKYLYWIMSIIRQWCFLASRHHVSYIFGKLRTNGIL